MFRFVLSLLIVCLGMLVDGLYAGSRAAPPQFDRLERPAGAIMVPRQFSVRGTR